jgi:hypothetical protein
MTSHHLYFEVVFNYQSCFIMTTAHNVAATVIPGLLSVYHNGKQAILLFQYDIYLTRQYKPAKSLPGSRLVSAVAATAASVEFATPS